MVHFIHVVSNHMIMVLNCKDYTEIVSYGPLCTRCVT